MGVSFDWQYFHASPRFAQPASAPPESEGADPPSVDALRFSWRFAPNFIKRPCKSFEGAFFCGMEWDEWQMVNALVHSQATVLELGARFGTTSCVLARRTANSGFVVSVEPDHTVHARLLRNRQRHNCSFHAMLGVVGRPGSVVLSRDLAKRHYARQTRPATTADGGRALPAIPFEELERRIGRRFDTLLLDCEGCIEHFLTGRTSRLLAQVSLVLLEEDAPDEVDYRKWHARLRAEGLQRIWRSRDTFEPLANWSRNVTHSAWRRGGRGSLPTCEEFRTATRLPTRWLDCRTA